MHSCLHDIERAEKMILEMQPAANAPTKQRLADKLLMPCSECQGIHRTKENILLRQAAYNDATLKQQRLGGTPPAHRNKK